MIHRRAATNTWVVIPESLSSRMLLGFETLECDGWLLARSTDGRFADDRCLEETASGAVLMEGVILNRSQLLNTTAARSTAHLLERLRDQSGTGSALRSLRGVFSGCFIDRKKHVIDLFVNPTGDTAVYLYTQADTLVASNSFEVLSRVIRENKLQLTFNERAARMMLSYGYMVDDSSFANEVHRLLPGCYAKATSSGSLKLSTVQYWGLSNEPTTKSLDLHVREFGAIFREAVRLGFDKDIEYGYGKHLADMSGGLDARTVNFVASDLGYRPITNITYGQFHSDDVQYARKTSDYLGNVSMVMPLDSGNCLLEPQEILRLNSGSAYYGGITGGKHFLESLNFAEFGLEHVGQLGDVVLGTFSQDQNAPPDPDAGKYSNLHNIEGLVDVSMFASQEMYMMQTRGFLGAVSTHLTRNHFTYAYSPFLDVDVLDYAMSIPVAVRRNHRFYHAWLEKDYPNSLTIPTTRRLHSPTAFIRRAPRNLRRAFELISSQMHDRFGLRLLEPSSSMNPFEYWLQHNLALQELLDRQLERAEQIDVSENLRQELRCSLARNSSVIDRLLGTTVVSMFDLHFSAAAGC